MSEELKQQIQTLAMRFSGVTGEKWFVCGIEAALEKFASQVCEQREKEHDEALMKVRIAEDAFQMDEALKIETPIGEMNALQIRKKLHEFQLGAEAAELALRSEKIAHADTHLRVQAKEQELAQWKEAIIDAAVVDWVYTKEHETNPRKAINDLIAWNCKVALDPAVSEEAAKLVAQASQQAIAETQQWCESIARNFAIGELEHAKYGNELRGNAAATEIANKIRSLTPSPQP